MKPPSAGNPHQKGLHDARTADETVAQHWAYVGPTSGLCVWPQSAKLAYELWDLTAREITVSPKTSHNSGATHLTSKGGMKKRGGIPKHRTVDQLGCINKRGRAGVSCTNRLVAAAAAAVAPPAAAYVERIGSVKGPIYDWDIDAIEYLVSSTCSYDPDDRVPGQRRRPVIQARHHHQRRYNKIE